MKLRLATFGLLAGTALASATAQSGDGALEAQCRATEVTAPDSCPCTITRARQANVSDAAMRSLFKDDGAAQPVGEAVYGRFWLVKSQCIAEATMASMGIALPGGPPAQPPFGAPPTPAITPSAPAQAAPATPASAAGIAARGGPAALPEGDKVVSMTYDEARLALEELRGTRWEGESMYGPGQPIRVVYDFRLDGLVTHRFYAPGSAKPIYASVLLMFASDFDPNKPGADLTNTGYDRGAVRVDRAGRAVRTGGKVALMPVTYTDLNSWSANNKLFMFEYRGGDEMVIAEDSRYGYENIRYRRVGRADETLPAELEDQARANASSRAQSKSPGPGSMNTVQGSFVRRFATLDSRPPQAGQCPHEIFVLKNGIRAPVSFAEFDEWLGRGDLRRVAVASRSAGKGEIDFDVRFDGKPRTLPRVNGAFDDRTFMISDDDYRISMQERARVGDETRGFSISDGYFSMPGGAELAYVIRRYGC